MSTMTLDTHALAVRYKKVGFTDEQVEAMVEAARETSALPDVSQLATKADIAGLETKIEAAKVQTISWVVTAIVAGQAVFFALSHLGK